MLYYHALDRLLDHIIKVQIESRKTILHATRLCELSRELATSPTYSITGQLPNLHYKLGVLRRSLKTHITC